MNKKKLIREQMEATLGKYRILCKVDPPVKGWIRAIRDALGMSSRQMAVRMGVTQQSVSRIEKDELSGSLTIKTMRKSAEALDCVFVYAFVPRQSLRATLHSQAVIYAKKQLDLVSQTMSLEAQSLSPAENRMILENMVERIVSQPPSNLWETR